MSTQCVACKIMFPYQKHNNFKWFRNKFSKIIFININCVKKIQLYSIVLKKYLKNYVYIINTVMNNIIILLL